MTRISTRFENASLSRELLALPFSRFCRSRCGIIREDDQTPNQVEEPAAAMKSRKHLRVITDETRMMTDEVWESVLERLPWRASKLYKLLRYDKPCDFESKTVCWVRNQQGINHEFSVIDQLSWTQIAQLLSIERNNRELSAAEIYRNANAFCHINRSIVKCERMKGTKK